MSPYLRSVIDVVLDRSPEEWIGGIFLALLLSLALAGAFVLCRRWVEDTTILLVSLGMLVNFACMICVAGYIHWTFTGGRRLVQNQTASPFGRPFGEPYRYSPFHLAALIIEEADANHDELLSTDEAAAAAAKFVEEADANGKGVLDQPALITALRKHMRPRQEAPSPPEETPVEKEAEPTGPAPPR